MNSKAALLALSVLIAPASVGRSATPPEMFRMSPPGRSMVQLSDGAIKFFFVVPDKHCASISSTDGGRTWSEPRPEFEFTGRRAGVPCVMLDRDGELHVFLMVWRGQGRRYAIDRCIDIWHCNTSDHSRRWNEPKPIFKGYIGSINGVAQLANGRIVLPHQYTVPGRKPAPPTGSHVVTTNYSDDGGKTWKRSSAKLTAPCYADFIGNNYGACEPTIVQLQDGRAWILMRTQTGFLYESLSPDGVQWSEAKPSRFHSSSSPAGLVRVADGRIVVFWNNCQEPSRVNGAPVYVNRDALHAAISDDEGKTWRGYREVYREPLRNEAPPKKNDRGTAYPFPVATKDGKILLVTGQGVGRVVLMRIDPDWLLETHHEDDFSTGLEGWHVFKMFGPAERTWRNRTQGARLVDHPAKPDAKVLHVRRPDEKVGDGAVWNFPIGRKGKLALSILLQKGFAGAQLALADRFIQPTDPAGEKKVLFTLPITSDGQLPGGAKLRPDRWYKLEFRWDLGKDRCDLLVDGQPAAVLLLLDKQSKGACYLRLQSTARTQDMAGFLIESVDVDICRDAPVHGDCPDFRGAKPRCIATGRCRRENGTVPLAQRKGTGPCSRPEAYLPKASFGREMDQSPTGATAFTL